MSKPDNYTSHTELSRLAHCEMSWKLRYEDGIKGEPSDAMRLGTHVHLGAAAITRGEPWQPVLAAAITEEGADPSLVRLEALEPDSPASTAAWLLGRYERVYGASSEFGVWAPTVVDTELELTATIPDTWGDVHLAYIDEVWEDRLGLLWVVERKTYGRGDRLAWVEVDPQLTLNLWIARANGIPAVGIVFDGIYTYRWSPEKPTQKALIEEAEAAGQSWPTKKAATEWAREQVAKHPGIERPDADSFTRLWLDRTDAHIEAALDEVRASVARRTVLRAGAPPVRNLGPHCLRCDQRTSCWESLAFPQDIEVLDD